jgi:hypothetical protein
LELSVGRLVPETFAIFLDLRPIGFKQEAI